MASLVLGHPDLSKPLWVSTDASDVELGAMLTQNGADGEHVVVFVSHLLNGAEKELFCIREGEFSSGMGHRKMVEFLGGGPI